MAERKDIPRISLAALAGMNARIGIMSFGGGVTALYYHHFVTRRQLLTEQDFLSALTVAQIIPGANVVNISVYIGQKLHGVVGAVVSVLALLAGPFFAVIGLYAIYDRMAAYAWVSAGIEGITAAAIGLLGMVVLRGAVGSRNLASHAVLIATMLLVGVARLPLIPVVLCVAPVSIALAVRRIGGDV